MKKLVEAVQARFEALRATAEADQSPVYLLSRDWDGSSISLRTTWLREIDGLRPKEPWKLQFDQKRVLLEGLLACPTMQESQKRQAVLNELRPAIAHAVNRGANDKVDVLNIITTASHYPGGIEALLEVVHFLEEDSIPWQNLEKTAAKVLPNLSDRTPELTGSA